MGWFDEQIKERRQYDDDAFSEAFANMASAVMGKRFEAAFTSDRAVTKDAIDEILKYYHVKSREICLSNCLRCPHIYRCAFQPCYGYYPYPLLCNTVNSQSLL